MDEQRSSELISSYNKEEITKVNQNNLPEMTGGNGIVVSGVGAMGKLGWGGIPSGNDMEVEGMGGRGRVVEVEDVLWERGWISSIVSAMAGVAGVAGLVGLVERGGGIITVDELES